MEQMTQQHPMAFIMPLKRNKYFLMCKESMDEIRENANWADRLYTLRVAFNIRIKLLKHGYLLTI